MVATNDGLPPCNGAHGPAAWNDHGGSFGHGYVRHYKCAACGSMAMEVGAEGGNIFLLDPTEADMDYLNGPLDILWRARAAEVQRFRDARWFAFVSKTLGREVTHDGQLDEWPLEDRRATYDAFKAQTLAEHGREPDQMRPVGCYDAPLPAQCPASWERRAFVRQRDGQGVSWWQAVNVVECAALPLPPDPRRLGTLAYFATVWARVKDATGVEIVAEEVPNGYYADRNKSEPWWTFRHAGAVFTAGWRKRVVNITASGAWDTRELARVAKADQVTYSERGGEVTVHAWTQAKVVEYLTLLLGAVPTTATTATPVTPDAAERRARALLSTADRGPYILRPDVANDAGSITDASSESCVAEVHDAAGSAPLLAASWDLARDVLSLADALRAAEARAVAAEGAIALLSRTLGCESGDPAGIVQEALDYAAEQRERADDRDEALVERDAADARHAALAGAVRAERAAVATVAEAGARYGAAWDAVDAMPPTAAQSEGIAEALRVSYEAQEVLGAAIDALLRGAPAGVVPVAAVRAYLDALDRWEAERTRWEREYIPNLIAHEVVIAAAREAAAAARTALDAALLAATTTPEESL